MNVSWSTRAGAAAIVTLLAFATIGTARANPRRVAGPRLQRTTPAASRIRPFFFRNTNTPVTTCDTNYATNEFVAIPGENDYAGASDTSVLGGANNEACDDFTSVVAGSGNVIGNAGNANGSFIGGGEGNHITEQNAFVGAGFGNASDGLSAFSGAGDENSANGDFSGDAAGYGNTATGGYSFIGAGNANTVTGDYGFVGAGNMNSVAASATYSVIVGGYGNAMNGQKASLGGGEQNNVSGSFATIPGGYRNEALGNESFAAGSQAEARYTGSFVWSDYVSSEKPQVDSASGQFVARASGGVYFFSNSASSAGVHLAAGSGAWSSLSDRNAKTAIVPLDDASILSKVASLPLSAWQYKTERGVRHIGPMAQDFYAAFGVGEDDRHITSIDEDGVALAAIKALHAENMRLHDQGVRLHDESVRMHGENRRLQSRLEEVEARDAILASRFDALLARVVARR